MKCKVGNEGCRLFYELPPNIKDSLTKYGAVVDKYSGLAASLLFDPGRQTIHVIMGGTGAGNDLVGESKGKTMCLEQVFNDITSGGILSNHVPPSYEQARDLVGAVKHFKEIHDLDLKIEVKGFSMGGGMASYAGIYHGVKALSHCGAPVSPACQRSLGSEKMEKAVKENMVFNTSVQGDWVSDRPLIQALGRSWETISSLQVARHVGNGLRLSGEGMQIGNKDWDSLGMGKHIKSSELFKVYEPKMIK